MKFLPGLMPLARDHHHVAILRRLEHACDSERPVWLDLRSPASPLEDLFDDRLRLLASWVVGRDDHIVGEARGDLTHERTLAAVAVAAASEDTVQTSCGDRPRFHEDVFQRFGRMRVVDQHGKRLPLVHRLEPARNPSDMLDASADRGILDTEEPGRSDRAQDILDVEAPAQPARDRDARSRE